MWDELDVISPPSCMVPIWSVLFLYVFWYEVETRRGPNICIEVEGRSGPNINIKIRSLTAHGKHRRSTKGPSWHPHLQDDFPSSISIPSLCVEFGYCLADMLTVNFSARDLGSLGRTSLFKYVPGPLGPLGFKAPRLPALVVIGSLGINARPSWSTLGRRSQVNRGSQTEVMDEW